VDEAIRPVGTRKSGSTTFVLSVRIVQQAIHRVAHSSEQYCGQQLPDGLPNVIESILPSLLDSLLRHEQLSVREYATKAFAAFLSRSRVPTCPCPCNCDCPNTIDVV
jgi:hypothetical protein